MDLQVFQSSKGTRVVTTSNLFEVLELPAHQYKSMLRVWVQDVYDFSDDVRKPQLMKDYSERKQELSKRKDYFISLEMAYLITLNAPSSVKLVFARKLKKLIAAQRPSTGFTKNQVLAVLELAKVMGLISCQKSVERKHLQSTGIKVEQKKDWWQYRAKLLGYSAATLKQKMKEIGENYKGKNLLQMLLKTDKYEIIRMAVIDLFLALGNSQDYASDMGDLAKVFAKELQVEVRDDRQDSLQMIPKNANRELVRQIRSFGHQGFLAL